MSRTFSIPTILRMVPNYLLQQWFEEHVPHQFDPNWDELAEREIDPLLDFLTDLPASKSATVEIDLQAVHQLACDAGMQAIVEAAKAAGITDFVSRMPSDLNLYGRSMWTRLNHREVFESSATLHELDNLSFWRKRNDLPSIDRPIPPEASERLGRAVSTMLKSQGRGQQCTVERLRRDETEYFFVYPDDYIRCEHTHDDSGRLSTLATRPTMQMVLAYNPVAGTLETFSRLNKALKEELERLFADCVLGWRLPPYDPEQSYELDHLKDESFRLVTDPVDQVRARITEMSVFNNSTGRPHSVGVDRRNPDDTIHRALREEMNLERVPLWQASVRSVAIRFDFAATSYRRIGHLTVRVVAPHSCNLLHASPDRVEIVQKHLKLWGIDRAESTPVAVGA